MDTIYINFPEEETICKDKINSCLFDIENYHVHGVDTLVETG